MQNEYLKFYGEKHISPVHEDADNYKQRLDKRKNLYRQLGIPILAIKGSKILEFGSAGGYNVIPLLKEWGAQFADLVEPNEIGRIELEKNLSAEIENCEKYKIYNNLVEKFNGGREKKYDIVIAEQFVQHLDNWKECLGALKKFTKTESIIITTCSDDIGFYVERMKRVVAHYYVKDIDEYEQKVKILVELFDEQFKKLVAKSRPTKDWVEDQIMNKVVICNHLMTMKDVMQYYKDEFDVLGTSQNIFTDYSWYKDTEYDYIDSYIKQYDMKKNMFLIAGEDCEDIKTKDENDKLEMVIREISKAAADMENSNNYNEDKLIEGIFKVSQVTDNKTIQKFNEEIISIIALLRDKRDVSWNNYIYWNNCFGKTSQYISLVRK